MDIKNSIKLYREQWEDRTGERSELAEHLSHTGRNAWRIIREMPEQMIETILKGIQLIPDEDRSDSKPTESKASVLYSSMIAVILPAICATVSSYVLLPAWLVGLSTFVVATISASVLLHRCYRKEQAKTLPKENSMHVEIDESSLQTALEYAETMLKDLVDYLASCDEDAKIGCDVTNDKAFGEWVQKFVNYANRNETNYTLQGLKGELISKLSAMGITVYDELVTDFNGNLTLPDSDYYEDTRTGNDYTKVNQAIVFSRRRLLARGELS